MTSSRIRSANIQKSDLNEFSVYKPCLDEQAKIASYLGVLDIKIDQITSQLDSAKNFKRSAPADVRVGASMSRQSEAVLEDNLVKQLIKQGYEAVSIPDEDACLLTSVPNLRSTTRFHRPIQSLAVS